VSDYRRVKGTRDLLPPETAVWAAVEETARRTFALYGYQEVRTPLLEHTELFVRTVGESTDIVGKEMYTFPDRKGRSLTLRPESTAAVARAFLEAGMQAGPLPARLFYIGPQFRYERPQKGRYRQFHQIGAELLGDASPWADAELLLMLERFLHALGFRELEVLVNTVGDAESRARYAEALRAFLAPRRDRLGPDSQRRLEVNPLRILDTKDPAERELLSGAPALADHLTDAAREHFAVVRGALERFAVRHRVSERLVRGLDYYTDTVFEIVSRDLGAQDALVGGGRYDELVADLGGPRVPGIGFAIGEDRLIEVLPASFRDRVTAAPPVLVAAVGKGQERGALELAEELRALGVACELDAGGRSLKAVLKRAGRLGVRWVALVGEAEQASGTATLKDLSAGEQRQVARADLPSLLQTTATGLAPATVESGAGGPGERAET
jgi:histidyl-tRNA synthetase